MFGLAGAMLDMTQTCMLCAECGYSNSTLHSSTALRYGKQGASYSTASKHTMDDETASGLAEPCTSCKRARVDEFMGVNASNGAPRHVPHIVHPCNMPSPCQHLHCCNHSCIEPRSDIECPIPAWKTQNLCLLLLSPVTFPVGL